MARKIKVHKLLGQEGRQEIVEMDLAEAKEFVENCYKWNCCVFNTKTSETVREITPEVEEISVILMVAGGG